MDILNYFHSVLISIYSFIFLSIELSTCTWIHQKTHWYSRRNGTISTSILKMKPLPKVITVLHQIHRTHPFQALKIPFSTVRRRWNIRIQTCQGKQNDIMELNLPNWLREENWLNLVRLDSNHVFYTNNFWFCHLDIKIIDRCGTNNKP